MDNGQISLDEACARLRAVGFGVTKPQGTNGQLEACRPGESVFYRAIVIGGKVSAADIKNIQTKPREQLGETREGNPGDDR